MKKVGLLSVCLLGGLFFAFPSTAQDNQSSQGDGNEEIVIRKKGDFPQKLDIQLNGDQVTINGKKPEDVEGNIEVIRRKSSDRERGFSFRGPSGGFQGFGPHSGMFDDSDMAGGNHNKALLGVLTLPSDSAEGARIEEVEKGTPADSAGLQKNDLITRIGSREIHSAQDLTEAIGQYEPGDVISVTFRRNGAEQEADVQLGRNDNSGGGMMTMPFDHRYFFQSPFGEGNPDDQGSPLPDNGFMQEFRRNHPFFSPGRSQAPKLGMRVEGTDDQHGVKVTEVTPGSAAEASGFKEGDVLTAIAGQDVTGIPDVVRALRAHRSDKTVEAKVERGGKEKTLQVTIPHDHPSADL